MLPEEATPITIPGEGEIVSVPVTLERGGTIRGTVLTVPKDPSADYYIYITAADDPAAWGHTFYWEWDRSFEVEGLPNGNWKVGAWRQWKSEYPEQPPEETVWYPGTLDWGSAGIIEIRDFSDVSGIEIVVHD
jgi:hypothetical protein